jgi:hypothetical protein
MSKWFINRRKFFLLSVAFFCVLFISDGLSSAQVNQQKITVLNPLGTPPQITLRPMAPRLDTLEGKTIYICDDGFVGGDILLIEMEDWFKKNLPKTKVIFNKGGFNFQQKNYSFWNTLGQQADALIIGMGH